MKGGTLFDAYSGIYNNEQIRKIWRPNLSRKSVVGAKKRIKPILKET